MSTAFLLLREKLDDVLHLFAEASKVISQATRSESCSFVVSEYEGDNILQRGSEFCLFWVSDLEIDIQRVRLEEFCEILSRFSVLCYDIRSELISLYYFLGNHPSCEVGVAVGETLPQTFIKFLAHSLQALIIDSF